MTYNIHKGIGGVDRKYRLERIVDTIRHYVPDIVLLQEVDNGVPRSRRDRQVDLLADYLDLPHRAYQANVRLKYGSYGNAILSRFPLTDTHSLDLTVRLKKRRRALVTRCRLGTDGHTRTLVVSTFHLGLAGFERTIQLRKFLNCDLIQHVQRQTPTIVGGDFNDVWGTLERRIMAPAGFTPTAGKVKTFPAAMPMRPLDRIYVRGDIHPVSSYAGHTDLARQASDHLPLVADLNIESGGQSQFDGPPQDG